MPQKPGWFASKEARAKYEEDLAKRQSYQSALDAFDLENMEAYEIERRKYELAAARNARLAQGNELVDRRQAMMSGLPKGIRQQPVAQAIGDRAVDASIASQAAAQQVGNTARSIHPGYYVGGAAALGSAGLFNAHDQLNREELPSGIAPTIGRAVTNLIPGGYEGPGLDPLAAARNNVRDARNELGSDRVLEALVLDQVDPQEAAAVSQDFAFEQAVDRKAAELMEMPKIMSDGSIGFMSPEAAYSQARQIIELDQRY